MHQETLKRIFHYDPETGIFRWLVSQPPRGKVGEIAGCISDGYIKMSYRGKRYLAHRLAFLYMTGDIPKEIDHINQCRSDNRWENLRASNRWQNLANVSGRRGVRYRYGRWYARYGRDRGHIGVFDTEEEARAAYLKVAAEHAGKHPDDINGQKPDQRLPRKHVSRLYDGKTVSELARQHGVSQPALYDRLHRQGLPLKQALQQCTKKRSGEAAQHQAPYHQGE